MDKYELKAYFDQNYKHFDEFLIDLGVSKKHLDYVKNIKINKHLYPREYYDFVKQEHNVTIPSKKIIRTNLYGNYGCYWYDLIKDSFTKEPRDITANIDPPKIWDCFKYLYVNGFDRWAKSYLLPTVGGGSYDAFITSDNEKYYVHVGSNGDGRHRLFSAMVGGVENILATSVEVYKYNSKKAQLFNQIKLKEIAIQNHVSEKNYLYFKRDNLFIKCSDAYFNYDLGIIFGNKKFAFLNDEIEIINEYIDYLDQSMCYLKDIDMIYETCSNSKTIYPLFYLKNKLHNIDSNNFTHKFNYLFKKTYKNIPKYIKKDLKHLFEFNMKYGQI
ncbi:hypothetical protein [Staphylococcus gallinarum]|uniref:hypothetical protein n=1 Tax=Staphylococcus gallinarum TaxID=1293 RepID=UPI001E43AA4C|nr:hypothetical protein [Staphylococcus gallinarum]MCD8845194.1 hypothetical protein [Staphylococcus gallinarum]